MEKQKIKKMKDKIKKQKRLKSKTRPQSFEL